jgi:hypothetical protein
MPNYNGFATNLQLGRLINVSSNWTFLENVEVHTGDFQNIINLTATGIPYHGYGSIYASTVPLAQYYNRSWVWRGGQNLTVNPQSVGQAIVGFWLNGVAIYSPSIDTLPPFGFTTPSGFHFDQTYANGVKFDEIDEGQHWYKQDLAGGRAKTTGRYFYSDYSFAPI